MKKIERRLAWMMIMVGGLAVLGGCASKKMVNDGLSAQETRLGDVETQVEENQRQIQQNEQQLEGVENEVASVEELGRSAAEKASQAYTLAQGKLLYTVVLDDTAGTFEVDSAVLGDALKAKLDQTARKLVSENADVFLEIAGHTDATASEAYNMSLGLRRAEAVRHYLNAQHSIPLHRMSVISYGESKPVADNSTREGRARNRRVEIRVLS